MYARAIGALLSLPITITFVLGFLLCLAWYDARSESAANDSETPRSSPGGWWDSLLQELRVLRSTFDLPTSLGAVLVCCFALFTTVSYNRTQKLSVRLPRAWAHAPTLASPQMARRALALMLCVRIDGVSYVAADMSLKCGEPTHLAMALTVGVPLLIIVVARRRTPAHHAVGWSFIWMWMCQVAIPVTTSIALCRKEAELVCEDSTRESRAAQRSYAYVVKGYEKVTRTPARTTVGARAPMRSLHSGRPLVGGPRCADTQAGKLSVPGVLSSRVPTNPHVWLSSLTQSTRSLH